MKDAQNTIETPAKFPVLKTIKTGLYKSAEQVLEAVNPKNQKVGVLTGIKILREINFSGITRKITFHVASVRDLTGKESATNRRISETVKSLGYDPCSPEAVVHLWLNNVGRPHELMIAVMTPFFFSNDLWSLGMDYDEVAYQLYGISSHHDSKRSGDTLVLFQSS